MAAHVNYSLMVPLRLSYAEVSRAGGAGTWRALSVAPSTTFMAVGRGGSFTQTLIRTVPPRMCAKWTRFLLPATSMLDLRWRRVSNAEVGVHQNRGIRNKTFLEKEYSATEEAQPGVFCALPHPPSCVTLVHHLPSRSSSTQVTRPA